MILIIHGNDIESSRNFFFEEKSKLKNPILINAEDVTTDLLYQSFENKNFFEENPTILIENFFSKIKANTIEFKQIVEYINKNKNIDIVFWENQEVSKTALSSFDKASVKSFLLPQSLFLFLDNIKPNNAKQMVTLFHDLLKTTEAEMVFFMITRQFRLLITQLEQAPSPIDEVKRMAPWQSSKFKRQLSYFSKDKLIDSYNKLFEMDLNHKTGKVPHTLEKSIDFFLASL